MLKAGLNCLQGSSAGEGYFAEGLLGKHFWLLRIFLLCGGRFDLQLRISCRRDFGPPAMEGYFTGVYVYSASSSVPPATEVYIAGGGVGLLC